MPAKTSRVNQVVRQIDAAPEGRQQARTHLFVAATLYAELGSIPIHIRNMSQSGALIEAPELPGVGDRVTLRRGKLHATGWIAWRAKRRAGVRLEATIHVADWMSRQVSVGQERVDALISIVRTNEKVERNSPVPANGPQSIEAELKQLRVELADLERGLIGDVIMVATHPEIQTIDISLQRIDRILEQLRPGG